MTVDAAEANKITAADNQQGAAAAAAPAISAVTNTSETPQTLTAANTTNSSDAITPEPDTPSASQPANDATPNPQDLSKWQQVWQAVKQPALTMMQKSQAWQRDQELSSVLNPHQRESTSVGTLSLSLYRGRQLREHLDAGLEKHPFVWPHQTRGRPKPYHDRHKIKHFSWTRKKTVLLTHEQVKDASMSEDAKEAERLKAEAYALEVARAGVARVMDMQGDIREGEGTILATVESKLAALECSTSQSANEESAADTSSSSNNTAGTDDTGEDSTSAQSNTKADGAQDDGVKEDNAKEGDKKPADNKKKSKKEKLMTKLQQALPEQTAAAEYDVYNPNYAAPKEEKELSLSSFMRYALGINRRPVEHHPQRDYGDKKQFTQMLEQGHLDLQRLLQKRDELAAQIDSGKSPSDIWQEEKAKTQAEIAQLKLHQQFLQQLTIQQLRPVARLQQLALQELASHPCIDWPAMLQEITQQQQVQQQEINRLVTQQPLTPLERVPAQQLTLLTKKFLTQELQLKEQKRQTILKEMTARQKILQLEIQQQGNLSTANEPSLLKKLLEQQKQEALQQNLAAAPSEQNDQPSSTDNAPPAPASKLTFAVDIHPEPEASGSGLQAATPAAEKPKTSSAAEKPKTSSAVEKPKTSSTPTAIQMPADHSITFLGSYDADFSGKKRNKTTRVGNASALLPEDLQSPRMRGVLGVAKVPGFDLETKKNVVLSLARNKKVEVYLPGPQDIPAIEQKTKTLSVAGDGFYVVKYPDPDDSEQYDLVLVEKSLLESNLLKVTHLGHRHREPVPQHERNASIKGKQYYEKVLSMKEYRARRNNPESTTFYDLTAFNAKTGAKSKLSLNIGVPLTVHPADSSLLPAVGDYCRQYGGGENDLVLMQVQPEGKASKRELMLLTLSQLSCYGFRYRVRPMLAPDPVPMRVKLRALTAQGKVEEVQLSTGDVYQARAVTEKNVSCEIADYCRRHNLSMHGLTWLSIPNGNFLPDEHEGAAALVPATREVLISKEQLVLHLIRFVEAAAEAPSAGATSK